jgi:hypothetical protein
MPEKGRRKRRWMMLRVVGLLVCLRGCFVDNDEHDFGCSVLVGGSDEGGVCESLVRRGCVSGRHA